VTVIPANHILCRWITLRPHRLPELCARLRCDAVDAATVRAVIRSVQHVASDAKARCALCCAGLSERMLLGLLIVDDAVHAYQFCGRHGSAGDITREILAQLSSANVPITVLPSAVAAVGHA
jgi:hypothetical protein